MHNYTLLFALITQLFNDVKIEVKFFPMIFVIKLSSGWTPGISEKA